MLNNLSIDSIACKEEAHPSEDCPQDVLQIAFVVLTNLFAWTTLFSSLFVFLFQFQHPLLPFFNRAGGDSCANFPAVN